MVIDMCLIDADALEKDGWMMHRTVQVDKHTMSYQTKKPTDFPTIEPERKIGRWTEKNVIHEVESSSPIEQWQSAKCSVCGKYHTTPYLYYFDDYAFCPNCGSPMEGGADD